MYGYLLISALCLLKCIILDRECALKMVSFHRSASKGSLTVVHKKYSNPKFNSVATLDPAASLH